MMDALLINFIGNSLFIIGLWTSCKEGMLLGLLIYKRWPKLHLKSLKKFRISFYVCDGYWSINDLPEWIKKPLYACPPCMASIWGGLGFIIGCLLGYFDPVWVLPYMVALAGLNAIIVNVVDFGE